MDLSRHMTRIIDIDAERSVARVQPGVVQEQLNLAAARHGLVFGPDTSTRNRATLGGMIGNNSAGSQSVRYGMTIDHVLTLDVVLSDASQSTFGPLTADELAQPRCRADARRDDLPGSAPPRRTPPGGHRHRLPAVLAAIRRLPAGPAGRPKPGPPGSIWRSSWWARRAPWSLSWRRRSSWFRRHGTGSSPWATSRPCRRPSRPRRTRWTASPRPWNCSTGPSSSCPAGRSNTGRSDRSCTAIRRPCCS